MLWETWLESAALGMSTTTEQAGIIISFILTIVAIILVAMAGQGKHIEISAPITSLFSILFFVYIGWFPTLLGTVIAAIMAVFVGRVMMGG